MKRWTLGGAFLVAALVSAGVFPFLKIIPGQDGLPSDVEAHYSELIKSAESKASQNQVLEAMQTIAGVPSNSEHFDEAQQLQESFARELLRLSDEKYNQADISSAIAILRAVPSSTTLGEQAQQQVEQFTDEMRLLDSVQIAQAKGDFSGALNQLEALRGTPIYNTTPIQQLVQSLIGRTYGPGSSTTVTADNFPTVPKLGTNAPVSGDPPRLAALAVDVDSALKTTRFKSDRLPSPMLSTLPDREWETISDQRSVSPTPPVSLPTAVLPPPPPPAVSTEPDVLLGGQPSSSSGAAEVPSDLQESSAPAPEIAQEVAPPSEDLSIGNHSVPAMHEGQIAEEPTSQLADDDVIAAPMMPPVPESTLPPDIARLLQEATMSDIDAVAGEVELSNIFGAGEMSDSVNTPNSRSTGSQVDTPPVESRMHSVSSEGDPSYRWQHPVTEQELAEFAVMTPDGKPFVLVRP
jgi:hypothetical protein